MTVRINYVKTSAKAYAYVGSRDYLYYNMFKLGKKSLRLPPQTQDSVLNLDLMTFAVRKDFEYQKHFNRLYAISNIWIAFQTILSIYRLVFQISKKEVLLTSGDSQKIENCSLTQIVKITI